MKIWLTALSVAIVLATTSGWVDAADRKYIRLYKLNSKGQFVSQKLVKNGDQPGCHNFLGRRKVNRFAQVGFAWCEIYSVKDCDAESLLMAMWSGKRYRAAEIDIKQPQARLLPGSKWLLHPSENIKVSSWRCSAE